MQPTPSKEVDSLIASGRGHILSLLKDSHIFSESLTLVTPLIGVDRDLYICFVTLVGCQSVLSNWWYSGPMRDGSMRQQSTKPTWRKS